MNFIISLLFCLSLHDYIVNCRRQYNNVIIIGAGMAGIGAAEQLEKNGVKNYVILEAENRIGGRILGQYMAGVKLPLGAGWIHHLGPYQPIWPLAQKEKLKVHYDNYDDIVVRDTLTGRKYDNWRTVKSHFDGAVDLVDDITSDRMSRGLSDTSLRAALNSAGWQPLSSVQKAIEFFMVDFENGVPPEMISSRAYGVTGEAKDAIVTDPRGMDHIPQVLAKPFRHKIKLNKEVVKIDYSRTTVSVHTKDGSVYTADNVLVTVSAGVINNNAIQFVPPLPLWMRSAFSLVPMSSYCKVFMRFPKQFWDDANYILLAHKSPGEVMHFQSFNRPTLAPNKNILLATITHKDCQRVEQLTDAEVIDHVMSTLKRVYGSSIPKPIEILRNAWESNPHFHGAYSAPISGIDTRDFESMKAPINNKIWFAGEAVTNSNDFGYVQGGYRSGQLQGKAIYDCWKRGRCKSPPVEKQLACVAKIKDTYY